MNVVIALICTLIAGVINGSFALPTKNIKQWNFENIWLNYSVWAFLIIPWVIIYILAPHVGSIYSQVPAHYIWILVIGGILFGIGQVCFAEALKMIGLGLGFVINIGLGTALGFFLPLVIFNPGKLVTLFGLVTIIATLLIIAGLVVSYKAGKERDAYVKQTQQQESPSQYHLGVILAIVAGLFSAGQNFTFAATNEMQKIALNAGANELASAMIIWPIFLIFTFIPYAIYMLYLHKKNTSAKNYVGPRTPLNMVLAFIMGLFWFCSLVLYSEASLLIGKLGPVVAWPLFMVLIILTSNFWGWRHKEWTLCSVAIQRKALTSIILLVIAVIALAYSATLSG